MAASDAVPMPEVVTEAIVVIDLVESTLTSNLFGWYAVGRQSLRDLRTLIGEVGTVRGLRCVRSTGDGYLLTFYDSQSAEMAAIRAVEAVFELLRRIFVRNREVSEERALNCDVRFIWARSMSYQMTARDPTYRWPSGSRKSRVPHSQRR